jgi:DNA-binding transcriptional LysR family regulator
VLEVVSTVPQAVRYAGSGSSAEMYTGAWFYESGQGGFAEHTARARQAATRVVAAPSASTFLSMARAASMVAVAVLPGYSTSAQLEYPYRGPCFPLLSPESSRIQRPCRAGTRDKGDPGRGRPRLRFLREMSGPHYSRACTI